MKKTTLSIAMAMILLLSIPPISRAEPYIMIGNPSCGEWLNETRPIGMKYNDVSWLFGYISAYNGFYVGQTKKELLTNVKTFDISAWMDKYCRENPLEAIADGVPELYKELAERQPK